MINLNNLKNNLKIKKKIIIITVILTTVISTGIALFFYFNSNNNDNEENNLDYDHQNETINNYDSQDNLSDENTEASENNHYNNNLLKQKKRRNPINYSILINILTVLLVIVFGIVIILAVIYNVLYIYNIIKTLPSKIKKKFKNIKNTVINLTLEEKTAQKLIELIKYRFPENNYGNSYWIKEDNKNFSERYKTFDKILHFSAQQPFYLVYDGQQNNENKIENETLKLEENASIIADLSLTNIIFQDVPYHGFLELDPKVKFFNEIEPLNATRSIIKKNFKNPTEWKTIENIVLGNYLFDIEKQSNYTKDNINKKKKKILEDQIFPLQNPDEEQTEEKILKKINSLFDIMGEIVGSVMNNGYKNFNEITANDFQKQLKENNILPDFFNNEKKIKIPSYSAFFSVFLTVKNCICLLHHYNLNFTNNLPVYKDGYTDIDFIDRILKFCLIFILKYQQYLKAIFDFRRLMKDKPNVENVFQQWQNKKKNKDLK